MSNLRLYLLMICLLAPTQLVTADEPQKGDKSEQKKESAEDKPASVTQHRVTIEGQEIEYTATAGKLAMKRDNGEVAAHIFYIAYTRNGVDDLDRRPLTFCFNGGPGSSSVWLHLGMLGPQRVVLPDDAQPIRPPYKLHPNTYSLLDITDLVFIDPVSTGFSRATKEDEEKQFHGYEEDLRSVGQFIHDYTSQAGRWLSPKFLIGESYGGLRAAGLSGYLRDRYNFDLNGIVFVSAVLDFQTIAFGSSNDLPYILFLPSYAATAWYHKALPDDLQSKSLDEVVQEAEAFAFKDYTLALLQGAALPEDTRREIVSRMARLTGLSEQYIERSNLRVSMRRFGKELLRDRGRVIGRFDSRYTGPDWDHAGESHEYDPSATLVFGPFTAALNEYVRDQLQFEDYRVYEILTGEVFPWSYKRFENRYVGASQTLEQSMSTNPLLKIFVASGHYDLATPPQSMDYSVLHLSLDPQLRENITFRRYAGGHMMYIYEPALKQLREDLKGFYEAAVGREE